MSIAPEIARLKACGVVPVVVIDEAEIAVPLAEALLAGGIDVIEITLRRPAAMAALEVVAKEVPGILPVAGTVVTSAQAAEVHNAGALAVVSPGFTESVDEAMKKTGLPWLPGVATASDCMRAVSAGRLTCKFFPARASRRRRGLEGALRSVSANAVLSDRRRLARQSRQLPRAAAGDRRRRLLARTG
jgi:2-dehydro-3-deoxyphosphogluconate aldolase/(4S)-4-hydroxy-2-oxoglutarate aldolase